ncbi:MAG: imidazole glycerol phosphate synthase subunit HisF [archaeon]
MLTKRIIPCLDVKDSKVVKGKNFKGLQFAGDAIELAKKYYEDGADELVFLDISASSEKRKTAKELVEKISREIFIPFTVGGGISDIEDIRNLLRSGADKVSINTAAVNNPELVKKASKRFGRQCIVVAIDAKKINDKWMVFIQAGKKPTELDAIEWSKKAESLGAGEILLTSIDADGTKKGYDIELTRKVSEEVGIPVIASGGAGNLKDILNVFKEGKADAALAASIYHYNKFTIRETKRFLKANGVEVRL